MATQEELIAGIAEIIEEVTGIEPSEVTIDKSFVDDLDIDSLSMVEIAVQTEDKYGVKIPDEDLAGLRTVGDAVAYIQKLEAENPEAAAAIQARWTQPRRLSDLIDLLSSRVLDRGRELPRRRGDLDGRHDIRGRGSRLDLEGPAGR